MLLQLLRFEILYQSKQHALPITAFLSFVLGYFLGQAGNAPSLVDFNAPFQISYYTGNFSLLGVFIIMFFAVSGVIRDHRYHIESLIYSSSIKKFHFFGTRFLGVFLFSLLGFSFFLPGFFLGVSLSDLDTARVASFQLKSYLWPFWVIIVPNIFICSALLFSASILSKSNVVVYASAVLIYILYFIIGIASNSPMFASSLAASPERMDIAALLDPFAISTFFEHTQFWTAYEKSNSFLSFSGNYLWNRVLWIAFSFLLLVLSYQLFSFREKRRQRKKKEPSFSPENLNKVYQATKIQLNTKSQWRAIGVSVKIDVLAILKSLPFIAILFILLAALTFQLYAKFFEGGFYSEPWYPYTNLVISTVSDIIPILSKILIVFYSAELVWKAREQKFDGLINVSPTLNWVFYLSKLIALLSIPLLLIASLIFICLIFQLASGFTKIDFRAYLLLFYHYGIPALILSILALFIQSVFKRKYLGMGINGLIILCLTTPLSYNLGIEHPMLRIAVMPTIPSSNMSGYGIQAKSFTLYAYYWLTFGMILSLLSFKLWNRQLSASKSLVKNLLFKRWKRWEVIAFIILIISFISFANSLYTKLQLEAHYQSKENRLHYRAQYELKYKQYERLPKLSYSAIKTKLDLYPNEEKYTVFADYQLVNKNTVPITQVFISENKKLTDIKLEDAKLLIKDTSLGAYLFEFHQPVLPGQKSRLRYHLTQQSLPFNPDYTIVKNGTYLKHEFFEPFLGYNKGMEIRDPEERKKWGLPEKRAAVASDQDILTPEVGLGDVDFETIVSTSEEQIALAPGNLIKHWSSQGRNYYHYKLPEKTIPVYAYLSAQYDLKKKLCDGIQVNYFYHPGHDKNHLIMEESTCATLAYCRKHFGPYPLNHLSIAEIPSFFPVDGAAQPGLVSLTEDKLHLIDLSKYKSFNLVAKRTAKEVAHQWWGMIFTPKSVAGAGFLTLGLAEYTSTLVLEQNYGPQALWELSKNFNENYFRGRSFSNALEPPLYLEAREPFLMKGKSALVLLAIRDLIGEEKLNKALQALINRHAQATENKISTLDFINELYKVSPKAYQQLLDEWMKEVIRYELSIDATHYRQLENGKYEITASITAQRFKTLSSGKEVAIGLDEALKIACFDKHPKDMEQTDKAFYLKAHPIQDDLKTIQLVVDSLPRYISIDPFLTRLDRNYADNYKMIKQ